MSRYTLRNRLSSVLGIALAGSLATALLALGQPGRTGTAQPGLELQAAGNPATPGNFTGHGFDQCTAPSQRAMDHWLARSPFLAVGIYISGKSRGCRSQPNLDARWVRTQLGKGWKLLPITLGPQASCNPHFPRYGNDPRINPRPGRDGNYWKARKQAIGTANAAVSRARDLGIVKRSVLYYDLEAFNISNGRCRESALHFLSAWTNRVRHHGYRSGVYSSAASGIKMLDDARVNRPKKFALPDQIWIADWDGKANISSAYVREGGWQPHRRVKQYQGGHHETWGGVTINIDRNFLDVGRGSIAPPYFHCGSPKKYVKVSFHSYRPLRPGMNNAQVKALKCLLRERASFSGDMNGIYGGGLVAAVKRFQDARGWGRSGLWGRRAWVALLATGQSRHVKFGAGNEATRNLQRALNAVYPKRRLDMTGVFDRRTGRTLRAYQKATGLPVVGVANRITWQKLRTGRRW